MKAVKDLREKERGRSSEKPVVYSTSEGRANFADVLQATSMDKAIIGFDRYGRSVAALVPIDAIRMIAGCDDQVSVDDKRRMKRMAQLLLSNVPERTTLVPVNVYRDKETRPASGPKRAAKKKRTRSSVTTRKKAKAAKGAKQRR